MQLSERQGDGATMRQHLHRLAASTGRTDPRLEAECPPACVALWQSFLSLSRARPAGMGATAIPPSEIEAWQRLHRVSFTPWELDTLAALDDLALTHAKRKDAAQ